MISNNIARRWKTLSGHGKWKTLLEPLDYDLKKYLIHYGERAQANYDAFNSNSLSKWAGSSRFAKKNLFSRVGLENGNPYKYKVVEYIYATSKSNLAKSFFIKSKDNEGWCKDSNFMGYVAVATDEGKKQLGRRDILVAWRGTVESNEWVKDFMFPLVSARGIFGKVGACNIHKGLHSIYTSANPESRCNKTSAREQALKAVRQLVNTYSDEEISITITGHSLGAMLATLNAADIVANGYNIPKNKWRNPCHVTGFAFASPRVGDSSFRHVFQSMEQNLHHLRIHNVPDIVPIYPPFGYEEVGERLYIDCRNSSYMNFPGNFKSWHNLEAAYLHTLAGTRENNGEFLLDVKRDISLVNKSTFALKSEYMVPANWWGERNKGMVQQGDGSWELDDHEKGDHDDDDGEDEDDGDDYDDGGGDDDDDDDYDYDYDDEDEDEDDDNDDDNDDDDPIR